MSAIVVQHVSKAWGATRAVDDVSFEVADGTLAVLLGPSGCGKSTTLRLIAGLEAVTAGTIFIAGEDVTARPPVQRNNTVVLVTVILAAQLVLCTLAASTSPMLSSPCRTTGTISCGR